MNRTGMGYTNFGVSRLTFVNTPIINVKLPVNMYGGQAMPPVRMSSALTQMDHFIENKMIIPKNKSVIYSRRIVFFYANRRYQSVNFTNLDMCFKYMSLPGTMSSVTNVNETELHFDPFITIGNNRFNLRSVVVLNKISPHPFASTGCSTIVVAQPDQSVGRTSNVYLYYNPVAANIKFEHGNEYVTNNPISIIPYNSFDPAVPGFVDMARKQGTVFVYAE